MFTDVFIFVTYFIYILNVFKIFISTFYMHCYNNPVIKSHWTNFVLSITWRYVIQLNKYVWVKYGRNRGDSDVISSYHIYASCFSAML